MGGRQSIRKFNGTGYTFKPDVYLKWTNNAGILCNSDLPFSSFEVIWSQSSRKVKYGTRMVLYTTFNSTNCVDYEKKVLYILENIHGKGSFYSKPEILAIYFDTAILAVLNPKLYKKLRREKKVMAISEGRWQIFPDNNTLVFREEAQNGVAKKSELKCMFEYAYLATGEILRVNERVKNAVVQGKDVHGYIQMITEFDYQINNDDLSEFSTRQILFMIRNGIVNDLIIARVYDQRSIVNILDTQQLNEYYDMFAPRVQRIIPQNSTNKKKSFLLNGKK